MEDHLEVTSESEVKKLEVSDEMKENLLTCCKWMKILVVLAFIGIVCSILTAIARHFIDYQQVQWETKRTVLECVAALIVIYPLTQFWQFATTTKEALCRNNNQKLENAFSFLALGTKIYGCLAIIYLVLTIIAVAVIYNLYT